MRSPRAPHDLLSGLKPYYDLRFRAPCNLECFFCYERPRKPLGRQDETLGEIERQLARARAAGYSSVAFATGELLLLKNWEHAVGLAAQMGFDERFLLTNLTLLSAARLERLARAGITAIGGTLFSNGDAAAQAASSRGAVYSRQTEALRLLTTSSDLFAGLHLVLTRPLEQDLWARILEIRELVSVPVHSLLVSAIEPPSPATLEHPAYTDGLDVDWPRLLERADREGLRLIVQNVPACRLGPYAHRSFSVRKRVARVLRGWPSDPALAAEVDACEILYNLRPPTGRCRGCALLPACHRFRDHRETRAVEDGTDDLGVVRRLLDEAGLAGEPERVVERLRWIASRSNPRDGAPTAREHAR